MELHIVLAGENLQFFQWKIDLQMQKSKGIKDEFFVLIEDEDHDGYFVPYLYVVLEDGYSVEDITEAVQFCLEPYMFPVEILAIDERPFFHFKTNRIELSKELKKKSSIAE